MSNVLFYDTMPERYKELIMAKAEKVEAAKGTVIFREGDKAEWVYLIWNGRVSLIKGESRTIAVISSNEFLWEHSVQIDDIFPFTAVCMTDTEYFLVPIEVFKRILQRRDAAKHIILSLSKWLHDSNERSMYLSVSDPVSRIAGCLLYNEHRRKGNYIELTLEDIGSRVNLRMETVSRKLREFEKAGYIERIGKGKLIITDYKAINEIFEIGKIKQN